MTQNQAAGRELRVCTASSAVLVCLFLVLLGPFSACAQDTTPPQQQSAAAAPPQSVIERIEFVGNRRIQRDTLLARILSHPGDPYNVDALQRDFRLLWNTGYFEDIRLEVEDSPDQPNGKIIVFYVTERRTIRNIHYDGLKSITESDILDAFKDRKLPLSQESQFDPTKVKRAEVIIEQLLAQRGHMFASVKATDQPIPGTNAVVLNFNVDEGPKVKVGHIVIQGNHIFSANQVVRSMRHSRPIGIPLGFATINLFAKTYDRGNLDQDIGIGIVGLYRDHGYFKINAGEPILKTYKVNTGIFPHGVPFVGRKLGIRTDITIPLEEGAQYRMGKLIIRSANPDEQLYFTPEFLENAFPIKKGQIFSATKIRKSFEDYTKLYGGFGFIDFNVTPNFDPDEATKTVNLTLDFDQGKQFFVRRIEFQGNTTTRDKVIRRELLLDEGSLFNDRLWELSILRLNQLGFFNTIKKEDADLRRDVKAGTVDMNLKVKEKGKQSISFSGGVSGLAGSFLGLAYQTNNFLGLGETLTFSANFGSIQRTYLFGFTEPYLLDRPISTGFTVFSNKYNFNQQKELSILAGQNIAIPAASAQNYSQNSKGFTLFATYPLHRYAFTRVGITYGWTVSDINTFSQASQLFFKSLQFSGTNALAGSSTLSGIVSSKITPSISYDTVNSPINPTAGKSFEYSFGLEGGPLRGSVDTLSNIFLMKYFHPTYHRRNVIGMRLQTAWTTGFSGKVLPPYERYYLGGETDVRGFEFFNISPWTIIPSVVNTTVGFTNPTVLNSNGTPMPQAVSVPTLGFFPLRTGGDFQTVGNLEYRIPIAGPVSVSLFGDMGIDGITRTSQLQLNPTAVEQITSEFPNPFFLNTRVSTRLPIISGTNFYPRTSTGVEIVVFLPIVNAPFRFYYAYNPTRLSQTISGSRGAYFLSPQLIASLPPGVLQTQIIPSLNTILDEQVQKFPTGLTEPRSTFRFTVARTF